MSSLKKPSSSFLDFSIHWWINVNPFSPRELQLTTLFVSNIIICPTHSTRQQQQLNYLRIRRNNCSCNARPRRCKPLRSDRARTSTRPSWSGTGSPCTHRCSNTSKCCWPNKPPRQLWQEKSRWVVEIHPSIYLLVHSG